MPPVSNKRYVAAFIWHLLFVIILRKMIVCKCFFWNAKKIVSPGKPAKNACFLFLKMVSYMYYEYGNAMTKEVECSGSVREWRSPAASRLRNVHLKFPFEHQSWRISGRLRRFGSVMGQECPTIVGNAGGTAEAWLSSQCVDGAFFIFWKEDACVRHMDWPYFLHSLPAFYGFSPFGRGCFAGRTRTSVAVWRWFKIIWPTGANWTGTSCMWAITPMKKPAVEPL